MLSRIQRRIIHGELDRVSPLAEAAAELVEEATG
jgi:hypothetical protein